MSNKKSKRAKVMALMAIKNQTNRKVHRVQLRDCKEVYIDNKKEFKLLYDNLNEESIPKTQSPSKKVKVKFNISKPEKKSTINTSKSNKKSIKVKKKTIKSKDKPNKKHVKRSTPKTKPSIDSIPPLITPTNPMKSLSITSSKYRNCLACTFQNKSSNIKCEICETPLASKVNRKRKRNEMENISNIIEIGTTHKKSKMSQKEYKMDENIWSHIASKVQQIVFESDLTTLTRGMVISFVKNELNLSEEQITCYRKQIKKKIKELAAFKNESNQSMYVQPKRDLYLNDSKYLKEYEMNCRNSGIINNIPSLEKKKQFLFCVNRNIKPKSVQIGYFVLLVDCMHLNLKFDYGIIQNRWKCTNCNVMNDMSFVFCSECTRDKGNNINSFQMTEMDFIWLKVIEHTEYGVLGNLSAKCSTDYRNKQIGEIMIFTDNYSDKRKMLNIVQNIRSFCDYKKDIKFKIKSNDKEIDIYLHSMQQPNKLVEIGST